MEIKGSWSAVVPARAVRALSAWRTGVAGLCLTALCLLLWRVSPLIAVAGASGGALWLMQRRHHSRWQALVARLDRLAGTPPPDMAARPPAQRLAWQVDALAARLSDLGHRSARLHGISGLPTREPLMEAIDAAPPGGCLSLAELCDFDRLSLVDPTGAEEVLTQIAQRLARMVGPDRFLAHVDRSRFAIWCPAVDAATARRELDAISYALQERITLPSLDIAPQIRSVLVEADGAQGSAAALIAQGLASLSGAADGALIKPGAAEASARNLFLLEQDLRQAVQKNEFELWFQPFIDAARQRICGAEALLRWHHPVDGTISPALFIPVMEASGLADEIGLWTLNAGCREAAGWEAGDPRGLKVAINLSAHQLERADLPQLVDRTLRRHGLAPALLELELTETVASVDSASARALFDTLRALGVAISIDDFGAGYSSLSYLKKLRFDKIKIDREFVSHVDTQRDSQAICQSIIALGRGLGIPVLAEGVERAEEYVWLRRHGCTLFQGYHFARPMKAADFRALVRDETSIRALTDLSPFALRERVKTSRKR